MSTPRKRRQNPAHVIDELMLGASRIQALYVAVRLGIPDLLSHGPRSSTVLASTTGVHPGALHRLMRFLVAEGEDGQAECDAVVPIQPRGLAMQSGGGAAVGTR